MTDNINEILKRRAKTHGDFKDQALLSQKLRHCFYLNRPNCDKEELTYTQKEAIAMIFHKIARIGAGNQNELDHWRDIAGYALLVVKELEQSKSTDDEMRNIDY